MKFCISILAAALFVLGGCQSPVQLRQSVAGLDEVTNVPAERLAGCVGDKLEASSLGSAGTRFSSRPTTNGFSISGVDTPGGIYSGSTDTPILVDITRRDDGKTRIQVWTNLVMGTAQMISLVRGCL